MFEDDQAVVKWAHQLVLDLMDQNQGEWASAIDAVLLSKERVELLGKLRFELCKLEASDVPDEMGIHERVLAAIDVLDQALETEEE